MGLTSTANGGGDDGFRLGVFDLRRGQNEGHELDKILFFYPADLPFSTQLSVIGLSEGLITFSRIFSPEAACEEIEAELHSHVFYEAEPDIWMVMVVEKCKEKEAIYRLDALRKVLKEVHSLFVMFHGSMRLLIEKDPSGGSIRSQLFIFIMDYLSDFLVSKKLHLPSFRDSLKERGTIQMLTIGREAALEVQSLIGLAESFSGSTSCHSLLMFQDLLVSTTFSPDDTVSLFSYAVLRLTPRVLSTGLSSWSYLRKGTASTASFLGTSIEGGGSLAEQFYGSCVSFPDDNPTSRFRPLRHEKWSKGKKDGFLINDGWRSEIDNSCPSSPTIFLQKSEERMYLCVYQHKNLTLILTVPVSSIANGEQSLLMMKQLFLADNASMKFSKVEEKLTKGWGGDNAYHVSGYRYLLVDGDRNNSRASPSTKVATLSKESLLALNKLRQEVDVEKSRVRWEGARHDKDLEISIRAKNNAWVVARTTRGKELYMVLENANETVLFASDAVEKFSNRYCNGAFSLD